MEKSGSAGVVTEKDRGSPLELVMTGQVRPAVGPVHVDEHVRRIAGRQGAPAHRHARRNDVERIRQRRGQKLEHGDVLDYSR